MSDETGDWACLELMGHAKYYGFVSEVRRFGVEMGRIRIPATAAAPAFEFLFGGSSIYRLTPLPEEVARRLADALGATAVPAYLLSTAAIEVQVEDHEKAVPDDDESDEYDVPPVAPKPPDDDGIPF